MEGRWKDHWRNVAVRSDVKQRIIIMAAEDDVQQTEFIARLVQAEAERRYGKGKRGKLPTP